VSRTGTCSECPYRIDVHLHRLPRIPGGDEPLELTEALHDDAVDAHDDVVPLESGPLGGGVLGEVLDEHAGDLREAVHLRVLRRDAPAMLMPSSGRRT
jgi:hypothetical protein